MFKRKKSSFYAAYDEKGNIYGFYHDVDSPPPKEAQVIKLTDKQWRECVGDVAGHRVKSGKLVKVKK